MIDASAMRCRDSGLRRRNSLHSAPCLLRLDMAEILTNQGNIVLAITHYLYVRSDDGVTYYPYGLYYDSGFGLYMWNRGEAATPPSDAINISNMNLGTEFVMEDPTGDFHGFSMTPTDLGDGYVWTDI